jgi:hypothetical protein
MPLKRMAGIGASSSERRILQHWEVVRGTFGNFACALSYEESVWQQEAGPTVFAPFPEALIISVIAASSG